jgi:hypothetical protein
MQGRRPPSVVLFFVLTLMALLALPSPGMAGSSVQNDREVHMPMKDGQSARTREES